jgi:hypothetical protein
MSGANENYHGAEGHGHDEHGGEDGEKDVFHSADQGAGLQAKDNARTVGSEE